MQLKEHVETIGAGEFKAKCLALIDEVFETGKTIIITKRGEERVMMVPIHVSTKSDNKLFSLMGCLEGMIEQNCTDEELFSPTYPGKDWDQHFDEKWERVERENELRRKNEK